MVDGAETVSVEVADEIVEFSVTLPGLREAVRPPYTYDVRLTLPTKAPRLLIEIVDVFAAPPSISVRFPGVANIVKSGGSTGTASKAELDRAPLVPVTLIR